MTFEEVLGLSTLLIAVGAIIAQVVYRNRRRKKDEGEASESLSRSAATLVTMYEARTKDLENKLSNMAGRLQNVEEALARERALREHLEENYRLCSEENEKLRHEVNQLRGSVLELARRKTTPSRARERHKVKTRTRKS